VPLAEGEIDSEDERAADFYGKTYPTKRPKRECLEYLKDIDMHGISPTLVAQGQSKFKTWWGASFSLLAIILFLYYFAMKVIFYVHNRTHYYVETLTIE